MARVIIALNECPVAGKNRMTYSAAVRYEVEGWNYIFQSSDSSGRLMYDMGRQVMLYCDPVDASRARIDLWWKTYVMMCGAAVVVTLLIDGRAFVSILTR